MKRFARTESFRGCLVSEPEDVTAIQCTSFWGHKWGRWIMGRWHTANFGATSGAMTGAVCKRCGLTYARWAVGSRGKTMEDLVREAQQDA